MYPNLCLTGLVGLLILTGVEPKANATSNLASVQSKAIVKAQYAETNENVHSNVTEPEPPMDLDTMVAQFGQALLAGLSESGISQDPNPDVVDIESFNIGCAPCIGFMTLLRQFHALALPWEAVKGYALQLCQIITPPLGFNGEFMCDGLIDVFGPHVYWVIGKTDKSIKEICDFHFFCPPTKTSYKKTYVKKLARPPQLRQIRREHRKERKKIFNKRMIKIAHITDAHLDELYEEGAPSFCPGLPVCCRDDLPGVGSAGKWGTFRCSLSVPTLHVILRFIAKLDVDLVLYTGDSPNHAWWEESLERELRQNEIMTAAIRKSLPGVPVHFSIGNHDTFPSNLYYGPKEKELLHRLRLIYQDLVNFTDDQIKTFEDGAYYTALLMPGLRLVVYNSEYSDTNNYYGVLLEDSPDWKNMTRFMEETFSAARENGEKILLASHHPMGIGFTFYSEFINDLMDRYGNIVLLHLLGHEHVEEYKMSLNPRGRASHVNIVTAPLYSVRNPAFKIISIDSRKLKPTEYETYFLNLSRPVAQGEEPVIELMYSSSKDYGMPDLTPKSFKNLTDRMEADNDLYHQFRWNEMTRHSEPEPCEGECRKTLFCNLRTVSKYEFNACMQK